MLAIQRRKIYNVVLFCVIFCVVGGLFILYHRVVPSSDEAIEYIGDISPLLRVGTAHPFLANLVKEIGGSYVTVISVSESTTQDESPTDICSKMSVFFGLNKQVDGWVQDICESKDDSFVDVFLDSYVGIPIDQDSVASSSLQTSRSFSISDKGFYWLSTQGGKDMARAIAKILSEADPVHKVSYLDNAYTVAYQLDDVYGSIKDPIYNLHIAPIIVWGDEWQELIAEYDGHIVQTIDPIQNEKERAS
jgi:ABC-type Zn uptake system ZnuABC Zn-binding protein ZnuA